ncbi:LCP family protein [Clostridium bornimense]|uniref:LCP family protein n=1 Tax=Clostridium bornimense TaxID=1216932 RepID=UPI000685F9B7|nr:LCP family protein [Clostridium bornimense]
MKKNSISNINNSEESMNIKRSKKRKRGFLPKLSKSKKILLSVFLIIILVGSLSTYLLFSNLFKKSNSVIYTNKITTEEKDINDSNEHLDVETKIKNILLIGVDKRSGENIGRTDSIMIATVDPENNSIKLTSVLRDTYVEIPEHGYNKINAAFAIGGVELLSRTLKYNFNITLDNYITIDFFNFQNVIDSIGGIEIDVKDTEVNEINKYIKEVNGTNSTLLTTPGLQVLNGQQALSYSRIRYVGNSDFERVERQKRVMSACLDKVKNMEALEYPKLLSSVYGSIDSDMTLANIITMGNTVYQMENLQVQNLRIPSDNNITLGDMYIGSDKASVVFPDLQATTEEVLNFIYPGQDFSTVTVPDNSIQRSKLILN